MLIPTATAVAYREPLMPFLLTIGLLAIVGLVLGVKKPKRRDLYARDGFAVVALACILMSAFGALPFVISGDIPNYVDAFFETVSGLPPPVRPF